MPPIPRPIKLPTRSLASGVLQHGVKPMLRPQKLLGYAGRAGAGGMAADALADYTTNSLAETPQKDWWTPGFSPAGAAASLAMTSRRVHGGKFHLGTAIAPRYPGLDRVVPQPTGNVAQRFAKNIWQDVKNVALRPNPAAAPRDVPQLDKWRQAAASGMRLTGSMVMPAVAAESAYRALDDNAAKLVTTGSYAANAAGHPFVVPGPGSTHPDEPAEMFKNLGGFGNRARLAKDLAMQTLGFGHDDPASRAVGDMTKSVLRTEAPASFVASRDRPLVSIGDKLRYLTPFGLATRPAINRWADTYGHGGDMEAARNTSAVKMKEIATKALPEILQNPEASANSPFVQKAMEILPESYVNRTAKKLTEQHAAPQIDTAVRGAVDTVQQQLPQWGANAGAALGAGTAAAGAIALASLLRRRKREGEKPRSNLLPWLGVLGAAGAGGYLGHRFGGEAATHLANTEPGQQLLGSLVEKGVGAALPDGVEIAKEYARLGDAAFKQKYPQMTPYVPKLNLAGTPAAPVLPTTAARPAVAPATTGAMPPAAAPATSAPLRSAAKNIGGQVGETAGNLAVDLVREFKHAPQAFFQKYKGLAELLQQAGTQMKKKSSVGALAAGAVLAPTVFGGALGAGLASKKESPVKAFGRGAVRGGGAGMGAVAGAGLGGVGGAGLGLIAAILSGKLAPGVNPQELKDFVRGGLYAGGTIGAGTGGVLGYDVADGLLKTR